MRWFLSVIAILALASVGMANPPRTVALYGMTVQVAPVQSFQTIHTITTQQFAAPVPVAVADPCALPPLPALSLGAVYSSTRQFNLGVNYGVGGGVRVDSFQRFRSGFSGARIRAVSRTRIRF